MGTVASAMKNTLGILFATAMLTACTTANADEPTSTPTPTPITPTTSSSPSVTPSASVEPSASESVSLGPAITTAAPQAKVEQFQTCRFLVSRYYQRDSGLDPWVLTKVKRTPTGNDCGGPNTPIDEPKYVSSGM